jgi:protein-L-isoaspartate O-methyltransferase
MNENHSKLCPSPEWADWMRGELLPSLTAGVDLGAEMLEIGPGPGAATGWLRHRVRRLVALEIDEEAAAKLAVQYDGGNVEVRVGDATAMTFGDASFDSVGTFPCCTTCRPSPRKTRSWPRRCGRCARAAC